MNKLMILTLAISLAFTSIAKNKDMEMIPCPEGMPFNEYMILLAEGGFVYKPNSGYGKILFVNKQNRIPIAQLHRAEKGIKEEIFVEVEFSKETRAAEIIIEITDNDNNRSLSVYPDDKKAIVNVTQLCADNPQPNILAERTVKQMMRAFVFLAGGGGGGERAGTLMDVMTSLGRLDKAEMSIPGDLVLRCQDYLLRSGVKTWTRATYKDACEEGWAAKPTNIWQKAIWDKVHAIPQKPMKIEFDPKKGR